MKKTYPIYRRDLCHFYKVYSEEKALQICLLFTGAGVNTIHAPLAFGEDSKESSEEEFYNAYYKAVRTFEEILLNINTESDKSKT